VSSGTCQLQLTSLMISATNAVKPNVPKKTLHSKTHSSVLAQTVKW